MSRWSRRWSPRGKNEGDECGHGQPQAVRRACFLCSLGVANANLFPEYCSCTVTPKHCATRPWISTLVSVNKALWTHWISCLATVSSGFVLTSIQIAVRQVERRGEPEACEQPSQCRGTDAHHVFFQRNGASDESDAVECEAALAELLLLPYLATWFSPTLELPQYHRPLLVLLMLLVRCVSMT